MNRIPIDVQVAVDVCVKRHVKIIGDHDVATSVADIRSSLAELQVIDIDDVVAVKIEITGEGECSDCQCTADIGIAVNVEFNCTAIDTLDFKLLSICTVTE